MRRSVQDPQGTTWKVGRRWTEGFELPRWRGRDPGLDGLDAAGSLADAGPLAILGLVIAVIALLVFLAFVALPLLFFGAELVVVLVVVLAGVLGRLVLGHPWLVEARTGGRVVVSRRVSGWGASLAAVEQLRTEVASGTVRVPAHDPSPTAAVPPAVLLASDEGPGDRELRLRSGIAVLLSLLWLGGLGSVVALLMSTSVLQQSRAGWTRAGAWLAIVLAFLGVSLTILLAIGIASEDIQLG